MSPWTHGSKGPLRGQIPDPDLGQVPVSDLGQDPGQGWARTRSRVRPCGALRGLDPDLGQVPVRDQGQDSVSDLGQDPVPGPDL